MHRSNVVLQPVYKVAKVTNNIDSISFFEVVDILRYSSVVYGQLAKAQNFTCNWCATSSQMNDQNKICARENFKMTVVAPFPRVGGCCFCFFFLRILVCVYKYTAPKTDVVE